MPFNKAKSNVNKPSNKPKPKFAGYLKKKAKKAFSLISKALF